MKRFWKRNGQSAVGSRQSAGIIYCLLLTAYCLLTMCTQKTKQAVNEKYTCPMHPQIVQDKPGTCPICGMDLVLSSTMAASDSSLTLNESQIKLANITTAAAEY